MHLEQIPTPALLLDLDRLDRNIEWMADRARQLGVTLRPHLKTHKCAEIAECQRAAGAAGFTVSTLYEAGVFAQLGFDDLTWAFPLVLGRVREVVALNERVTLRVTVDSVEAVRALETVGAPLHVWLKVDCGYHRAGVDPAGPDVVRIAEAIHRAPTLTFDGILSHSGHTYDCRSPEALAEVAEAERRVMTDCAERLHGAGLDVPGVSVGSTPSMRAVRDLTGVTEARPGNYTLFDYSQVVIGSCTVAECAATVASTVISSPPGAAHSLVDAGALALSKDAGPDDRQTMGEIFEDYPSSRLSADLRVVGMSQEHGRLSRPAPIGEVLRILPNHSCLTVAQFDEMYVVRGDEVLDRWKVWRGRS